MCDNISRLLQYDGPWTVESVADFLSYPEVYVAYYLDQMGIKLPRHAVCTTFVSMDARLKHPFTCIVAGPTGCGKTQWTVQLVERLQEFVSPVPEKIVWCYGKWQPAYENIKVDVDFVQGMPEDFTTLGPGPKLLIIDDLMRQDAAKVAALFEMGSHHDDVSVVYLVQNVFHQGKDCRDISLNAHYLVLFKNPRDRSQIVHLGKQAFPGNARFLTEAYDDACRRAHGYLFMDFRQATPECLRVRGDLFASPAEVYVPAKRNL